MYRFPVADIHIDNWVSRLPGNEEYRCAEIQTVIWRSIWIGLFTLWFCWFCNCFSWRAACFMSWNLFFTYYVVIKTLTKQSSVHISLSFSRVYRRNKDISGPSPFITFHETYNCSVGNIFIYSILVHFHTPESLGYVCEIWQPHMNIHQREWIQNKVAGVQNEYIHSLNYAWHCRCYAYETISHAAFTLSLLQYTCMFMKPIYTWLIPSGCSVSENPIMNWLTDVSKRTVMHKLYVYILYFLV